MRFRGSDVGGELVIGLVNNMPPRALRRTRSQFGTLLQAASAGRRIRLRCFASCVTDDPDHEPIGALWESDLAGLIVTGVEPQATDVPDEPLWPLLARLTDWAADNTDSAIWSCMATQAAVFRLSGLRRHRLPTRLSGLYTCGQAGDHPLGAGLAQTWMVPHSRYFDLDSDALRASGYDILSTGPGMTEESGVDSFFIEAGRSLFLMLQGHPEYGVDSLLLEYRRDVRRHFAGTAPQWPRLPARYFDPATEAALLAVQSRAAGRSIDVVLADLDNAVTKMPVEHWRSQAVLLFENWLTQLTARALVRCVA